MLDLDEDIENEDSVNTIMCEDCGEEFLTEQELDHHNKTVH